ncbi:MAG: cadmium-translocating P-type ATPase [Saprospiraceae bacterium]|nr:cadmium-translocating P-type ATPase [Saprospiraceae bacterium]HRD80963.1 cation-translocating P-type ATPase [Saprospiraceae bacterium]
MDARIIEWKVDGMDCNNCAAGISRFLERKGMQDVFVSFSTKDVRFRQGEQPVPIEDIKAGIRKLGYIIIEDTPAEPFWTLEKKLLVSALLTAPLLLHHFAMMAGLHWHWLENAWVQLALCLPVYALGAWHFGRSALGSLRSGVPNMDVLIFIGSTAAFVYSLIGAVLGEPKYIFFETAATIITLVLAGNWLEKRAVAQTTTAIGELSRLQVEKARKIMPSGAVVLIDKDDIAKGDLLQVNEGDKIPADGIVEAGNAWVDESMLTGESLPVEKRPGDTVIGASLLQSGNMRMRVQAAGRDTVLSQMIELVRTAQQDKPAIQRLADRISAVFVPVVVSIAALTFLVGYFGFQISPQQALMNAIAVLVISCPCAMGLATPTAVMVGVGRLARNGILVKGGQTVETLAQIRNIVFDKTGTLTTGAFRIKNIALHTPDAHKIYALIHHLEQHSSHPVAQALVQEMNGRMNGTVVELQDIEEQKGVGVSARDAQGNVYKIGSARILPASASAGDAAVFLTQNDQLLAAIELDDEMKPDAAETVSFLKKQHIHPVILSGDKAEKTGAVAASLGIQDFYAEQLPAQKLERIAALSAQAPTAMVGDGINDAPALSRATLGISLSNASQAAIQSAQIILLNGRLDRLRDALHISKHTVLTIRQNLFWAFAYNIVAIPLAAAGYLSPMWGALFMAFSDVVVIGNSIRLKTKKLNLPS